MIFDHTLRIVDEKIFTDPVREISAIRRFENSDCLAVGMYKDMYVVEFKNNQFKTLYRFNGIHSGENISFLTGFRAFK